jgi:alpha-1,3-rhamnosyl/mannosyltransferase
VSNADLSALMTGCAAFAYLSRREGFGLPPLEAMACGAAVVTSNTTSLPEVVGDAGVMVDPDDVDGAAAALLRLLVDEDERERRRRLSLERAATFTWARTAELTLRAYEAAAA